MKLLLQLNVIELYTCYIVYIVYIIYYTSVIILYNYKLWDIQQSKVLKLQEIKLFVLIL